MYFSQLYEWQAVLSFHGAVLLEIERGLLQWGDSFLPLESRTSYGHLKATKPSASASSSAALFFPPTHPFLVSVFGWGDREVYFASLFVTVRSYFIILGSSWINFSLGQKQIVLLLCCWRGGIYKIKEELWIPNCYSFSILCLHCNYTFLPVH